MKKMSFILILLMFVSIDSKADSWWRKYDCGWKGGEIGYSLSITPNGDYLIAGARSRPPDEGGMPTLCLFKTNENGDTLWTRTYEQTYLNAYSALELKGGEYIMTGGYVGDSLMVMKTDSLRKRIWNYIWRNNNGGKGYWIIEAEDGGYVVAGTSIMKFDTSGKLVWLREYDGIGYYVSQTSDGGFIVCGQQESKLWLLKTDSRGKIEWERLFGPLNTIGYSVHETSDGGFLIGASATFDEWNGNKGIWIVKTDSQGDTLWTRVYDDKGQDYCLSMEPTSDGNYIASGYTTSFGAGSNDAWFMKIDPQGNIKWKRYWAGPGDDHATYACQTSDGGYIITGYTSSFVAKNSDLLLIKTDAYGNLPVEISPTSILYPWYENLSFDSLKPKARFINKSSSRYNHDVYYHCAIVGFGSHEADRHDSVLVKGGHDAWKAVDIEFPVWTAVHPSAYKATFWVTGTVGYFPSEPMSITFYKKSAVEESVIPPSPSVEFVQTTGTELTLRYSNYPSGFRAEIFDASGRKVDELRSGSSDGALSWGSGHSSGVYFLRFSEGESTRILKAAIIH